MASREEVLAVSSLLKRVKVSDAIIKYIVAIVQATRKHPSVRLGASPRAAIALLKLSMALALLDGRGYVVPDDVKRAALPVLRHRILLKPTVELEKRVKVDTIIEGILNSVPTPSPPGEE